MEEYGLFAVVANDTSSAGKCESKVILVRKGRTDVLSGTKTETSETILDLCFGGL